MRCETFTEMRFSSNTGGHEPTAVFPKIVYSLQKHNHTHVLEQKWEGWVEKVFWVEMDPLTQFSILVSWIQGPKKISLQNFCANDCSSHGIKSNNKQFHDNWNCSHFLQMNPSLILYRPEIFFPTFTYSLHFILNFCSRNWIGAPLNCCSNSTATKLQIFPRAEMSFPSKYISLQKLQTEVSMQCYTQWCTYHGYVAALGCLQRWGWKLALTSHRRLVSLTDGDKRPWAAVSLPIKYPLSVSPREQ